jgi:glycosyltransferase involved in cell wall biosynthesis
MRIALCLEYPIALRGGVSVLVEALLEGFVRQGHQVILVSDDTPETLQASPAGKLVTGHFPWNWRKPSAAAARKLAGQLAGARVDLAHFHSGGNYGWGNRFPFCSPIYFLDRLGIPCVSTVHLVVGILDGYCGPQKPVWFKALMFPLAWCGKMHQLRHTRHEIAVSQHDLKKLQCWYGLLSHRFTQIYHSRLQEESARRVNPEREPVILNVGHLAWRKGQRVLAEAFAQIAARHPEWKLQFAGEDLDGETSRQILEIARAGRLEDRIQMLGERGDAFTLMRRAAIYVQPSFWEALGLALQEAMFCGCACIGSRAGGIPELIDAGRTGLLFEPGDAGQLAQALEQLIQDAGRREQFAAAAAASIRKRSMTVEGMARRHLELYEGIARKN